VTTVVGGVYEERCIEPRWDDVYGSAGRAAAAISAAVTDLKLVTYRARQLEDGLESLSLAYGLSIDGPVVDEGISFDYFHSLAVPRISPRPDAIPKHEPIVVQDDVVLRFGMLEGTARVGARTAVYDPQSAFDPRPFRENGSTAERLALVLNRLEARRFTGEEDPQRAATTLIARGDADCVVLKLGAKGALVATAQHQALVPSYVSDTVFKIGSGDVFSAAFTLFWAVQGRPPEEAADLACRAVSRYVNSRSLPIETAEALATAQVQPARQGQGCIYLAAPFFNLGERWLVEETRTQLLAMGASVFSPLHDVGVGPGEVVAAQDLAGLDKSQVVLAVLAGADAGTLFEVGYAVSRDIPVIALAQNMRPEDLKMPSGTGCRIVGDLVSAIYQALWALP
jgi:hypothetical protein